MLRGVGQVEAVRWRFSQSDFDRFAALSGDDNPIHVDPAFAAQSKFGRTVAHGMFLYSVVCGVLGTRLPGPGTSQLEQELIFPSPTYAGEEVSVEVAVMSVDPQAGRARLATAVVRPEGQRGLDGQTLVRLPGSELGSQPGTGPAAPTPTPLSRGLGWKRLEVAQRATVERAFTVEDLAEYADLTGDTNPVSCDAGYARRMGWRGPVIPGGLLGGLFSYLLGTQLPGRGTNYLKQRLEFPGVAHAGQELRATVEITRIRPEKRLVNLSTLCVTTAGEPVCRGEALVLVSDVDGLGKG